MLAYEEIIGDEPQQEESAFNGFGGFASPDDWATISAFINTLSEFKIVEWLLRHVWDEWVEITTETFMHGYDNEDGTKTDYGTGLSKPSVLLGIKKAIQHGLIEQGVDETDKTRIRKFYRVKIFVSDELPAEDLYPDVNDLYSDNMPVEPDFMRGKAALPLSNNSNNIPRDNDSNIIRITERQKFSQSGNDEKYPAHIRSSIKELSIELGDPEHIPSNIAQATKLYRKFGKNDPEEFQQKLDEAKRLALKACIKKLNSRGHANRMPYCFKCLGKLYQQ